MPTTTVANAVIAIRDRLDEPVAAQWPDTQLRRWLNEAQREIARTTFHWTDIITINVTMPATANGLYVVPDNVIRINRAYFTATADVTRQQPLQARAWDAMDNVWWDFQTRVQGGDPMCYASFGYSPTVTLKLWPVPYRAGTLTLHVARMPADIDIINGTGNIDMPTPWLEVAYDYCEYMALMKDRQIEVAQMKYAQFQMKLGNMVTNGDYLNAPDEFVWDGAGAGVPRWIADPNW